MEFIKELATLISSLAIIISTIFGIEKFTKGKISEWFQKPVLDKIDTLDVNQCRNYLVDFIADVENGVKKNEVQIQRAYEYYDHYVNDLKGNSYIHDRWTSLKNKKLI